MCACAVGCRLVLRKRFEATQGVIKCLNGLTQDSSGKALTDAELMRQVPVNRSNA